MIKENYTSKDTRYEIYEGGGFAIRITPNGAKTWIRLIDKRIMVHCTTGTMCYNN